MRKETATRAEVLGETGAPPWFGEGGIREMEGKGELSVGPWTRLAETPGNEGPGRVVGGGRGLTALCTRSEGTEDLRLGADVGDRKKS